jgi:hypothetical protein
MHAISTLAVLGLEGLADRARREGHVVGRGEGFVSREWRTGGVGLAVHTDGDDRSIQCVQPIVAGAPWGVWSLEAVHPGKACAQCAPAVLRSAAGDELRALVPDYAARRKMFPVGLEVQAAVVVVAEEWRLGERADALAVRVAGEPGAALLAGGTTGEARVMRNDAVGLELAGVELCFGNARVLVVGRPPRPVEPGEPLVVSGRALARIGAPRQVRGAPPA